MVRKLGWSLKSTFRVPLSKGFSSCTVRHARQQKTASLLYTVDVTGYCFKVSFFLLLFYFFLKSIIRWSNICIGHNTVVFFFKIRTHSHTPNHSHKLPVYSLHNVCINTGQIAPLGSKPKTPMLLCSDPFSPLLCSSSGIFKLGTTLLSLCVSSLQQHLISSVITNDDLFWLINTTGCDEENPLRI